jgi:hypothetical protein
MSTEFPLVFNKLKGMIKPYTNKLTVKTDKADLYYLNAAYNQKWKRELSLLRHISKRIHCDILLFSYSITMKPNNIFIVLK